MYWGVADALFRQERARRLIAAGLSASSLLGLVAGVAWTAWSVAEGRLSAGQFSAMLIALGAVQDGVGDVVGRFGYLGRRLLNIADLFVYLDLGPEDPPGGEEAPELGSASIEAKGVAFRYPQSERAAVQGVSFTVRPGEQVALVGANGSGKTTLVKVLLGLFRPTEGKVLYGGRDLAVIALDGLWEKSAAVFQDYTRFAFTLRENIGYGRLDQVANLNAVQEAARQGGADEVAEELPSRYETLLTKEFSGGTEFLGGQWHRVAISRAFMRTPELVVLDEPTASLDPHGEADVFRRFLAVSGGRTTLSVSHRLGSARLCDRNLVPKEGRLVESGTHEELVARNGECARMWRLQSRWYEDALSRADETG